MSKTIKTKILIRNDTSENWNLNNPILSKGQIGFDTDEKKHKIGDGISHWNELDFFALDADLLTRVAFDIDTTTGWSQRITQVSQLGKFYIYTDRETIIRNDKQIKVAGIKIGDGLAYVVDLPFTSISETEREFWNNKVRCYIDVQSLQETENLVFTTN